MSRQDTLHRDVHEAVAARLKGTSADDVDSIADVCAVLIGKAAATYRLRSLSRANFVALVMDAWDQCDGLVRLAEAEPAGRA